MNDDILCCILIATIVVLIIIIIYIYDVNGYIPAYVTSSLFVSGIAAGGILIADESTNAVIGGNGDSRDNDSIGFVDVDTLNDDNGADVIGGGFICKNDYKKHGDRCVESKGIGYDTKKECEIACKTPYDYKEPAVKNLLKWIKDAPISFPIDNKFLETFNYSGFANFMYYTAFKHIVAMNFSRAHILFDILIKKEAPQIDYLGAYQVVYLRKNRQLINDILKNINSTKVDGKFRTINDELLYNKLHNKSDSSTLIENDPSIYKYLPVEYSITADLIVKENETFVERYRTNNKKGIKAFMLLDAGDSDHAMACILDYDKNKAFFFDPGVGGGNLMADFINKNILNDHTWEFGKLHSEEAYGLQLTNDERDTYCTLWSLFIIITYGNNPNDHNLLMTFLIQLRDASALFIEIYAYYLYTKYNNEVYDIIYNDYYALIQDYLSRFSGMRAELQSCYNRNADTFEITDKNGGVNAIALNDLMLLCNTLYDRYRDVLLYPKLFTTVGKIVLELGDLLRTFHDLVHRIINFNDKKGIISHMMLINEMNSIKLGTYSKTEIFHDLNASLHSVLMKAINEREKQRHEKKKLPEKKMIEDKKTKKKA
jgi:hypothetical protein